MGKLDAQERRMLASPDDQISLTDPDSRSMATQRAWLRRGGLQRSSGGGHRASSDRDARGDERGQRYGASGHTALQAKAVLKADRLDVVADRGYYDSEQICHPRRVRHHLDHAEADDSRARKRKVVSANRILPTSPEEDVYRCPAGERLTYRSQQYREWPGRCGAIGPTPVAAAR